MRVDNFFIVGRFKKNSTALFIFLVFIEAKRRYFKKRGGLFEKRKENDNRFYFFPDTWSGELRVEFDGK